MYVVCVGVVCVYMYVWYVYALCIYCAYAYIEDWIEIRVCNEQLGRIALLNHSEPDLNDTKERDCEIQN